MTEHTPTPWHLFDEGATTAIMATTVPAPKNEVVHWSGFDACHFSTRRAKANAAFIVKAVNSHDALVKALETIIDHDTVISDGGKVHDHGACATIAIHAIRSVVGNAQDQNR